MDLIQALAAELGKDPRHVENVVHLLDEGNTIPFIARYRKELHGAMDDTSLRTLEERLQYLRGLEERREAVKKSIDEQGKLTDELAAAIDSAKTLAEVEDLYRPYKQKRRTRATMAKEKGLEPLAALLFAQERDCPRPEEAARDFVDPEKGVETVEDALQGASDIIAEQISDDASIRKSLRALISRQGQLVSRAATEAMIPMFLPALVALKSTGPGPGRAIPWACRAAGRPSVPPRSMQVASPWPSRPWRTAATLWLPTARSPIPRWLSRRTV